LKNCPSPDCATDKPAGQENTYHCGSLTYTRKGLIFLFAWLLWGDLCFQLMETVVPSILPLKLRSLEASNTLIGIVMSVLPGIFNTTICPWVSFKSDRYRSRWGRRIPFILSTMPFLSCSLILIGFSDSIGTWVYGLLAHGTSYTRTMVTVGCLASFAGLFSLFNMFVATVYWYLFNDVVPQQFLARIVSYCRLGATITSIFYNVFIFKHALSHMREIFLGAAVLYFVGYGLVCLNIKEGVYPPPDDTGEKPGFLGNIRTFARECYTMPFYWDQFLYTMFGSVSGCVGVYTIFFNQSLGLSLGQVGNINAVNYGLVAVCLLFAGSFVDRWNPVRVMLYSSFWTALTVCNSLIWLVADTPPAKVLFIVSICGLLATGPLSAFNQAADMARTMILFPRSRFGQFCGAQALVRAAGTMVGGAVAGLMIDFTGRYYEHGSLFPYRYIFIWLGFFACLAAIHNYRAYRTWKRLGGEKKYVPPITNFRYADLKPASDHPPAPKGPLVLFAILCLCGVLVNLFWIGYFWFIGNNQANAIRFACLSVLMALQFWVFVRLVRVADRP